NTHNVFFASVSTLEETVDSAFELWSTPNDQLRTLCSFKGWVFSFREGQGVGSNPSPQPSAITQVTPHSEVFICW
ncbi:MAG: hypothetical protein IKH37_00420, partial [Prevotella sp.]|nr:hypothetical protein [Prevotella sp.]